MSKKNEAWCWDECIMSAGARLGNVFWVSVKESVWWRTSSNWYTHLSTVRTEYRYFRRGDAPREQALNARTHQRGFVHVSFTVRSWVIRVVLCVLRKIHHRKFSHVFRNITNQLQKGRSNNERNIEKYHTVCCCFVWYFIQPFYSQSSDQFQISPAAWPEI